jgi:tol-pal system protein YbgF
VKQLLNRSSSVVVLAALPLVAACVMPDELSQMQKDVADVQQMLKNVERNQQEMQSRLDGMDSDAGQPPRQSDVTREELADTQLRLDQFSRQLGVVGERMSDIDQRLDRYSQDLQRTQELVRLGSMAAVPGEVGPPGTDPGMPPSSNAPSSIPDPRPTPPVTTGADAFPDPEALYNTAYADFSKGNYALAVSGFQEYQQRFPDSALADNALYWIAECHFSQGDFGAAVVALDDRVGRYPDSDKAPAANLKKALAFQEQNQIGQAIIQYRYVASAFPDSDEARLARDKLAGLGASPN